MTPAGVPMVKPRELIRALERMGLRLLRKSKGRVVFHTRFFEYIWRGLMII